MLRSQDNPSRSAGSSAGRARVTRADTSQPQPFQDPVHNGFPSVPGLSWSGTQVQPHTKDTHNQRLSACLTFVQTLCARTVCRKAKRSDSAYNLTWCRHSWSVFLSFSRREVNTTSTGPQNSMLRASPNQTGSDKGCWPMQVHLGRA